MDEGLIVKLVEFVEATSPVVWAAARQQVTVRIWQNALWIVALLILLGGSSKVASAAARGGAKETAENKPGFAVILIFALGITFSALVLLFTVANTLVGLALNPNYYAIEALLDLFPGTP